MATIGESVRYIRSKNAGPFWITIDIFCDTHEQYDKVAQSKSMAPEVIADVYRVDPSDIKLFLLPSIKTVKISYPRSVPQGSKYESDMHAGQQYVQIAELPL